MNLKRRSLCSGPLSWFHDDGSQAYWRSSNDSFRLNANGRLMVICSQTAQRQVMGNNSTRMSLPCGKR